MTTPRDRLLLTAWLLLPVILTAAFLYRAIAGLPYYADQPQHSIPSQPAPTPVPVERGGNR